MRYFLHLAYQGGQYSGWQRQQNALAIQQVIEEKLSAVLKHPMIIHGCGRTDAGVHALQYFAHFDFPHLIDKEFITRININLPDDIAIYDCFQVDDKAHAQYDATKRTYDYYLHTSKNPLLSNLSAYYGVENVDFLKIIDAVQILKNTKDFRSLCKKPDLYKHTECTIYEISFIKLDEHQYKLTITSNRFLRGMIRYMVARLLDIGLHKLSLDEFETTLSNLQEFSWKHQTKAFPQGLYLTKIEYPYVSFATVKNNIL